MDVTPLIDYNIPLLNQHDLEHSFFQLDKSDPLIGFMYDASVFSGPTYPPGVNSTAISGDLSELNRRLILASHLANHMRHKIEENKGYTATVGISTSKLLSKLVGNLNKPRNQTTLIPPYTESAQHQSNVVRFINTHEIGKIPGIGFKIANRIRAHVLGRKVNFELYQGLPESEHVDVETVRSFPNMGPRLLDTIFQGGGWPRDIGARIWNLLNGIDNAEVAIARTVPTQISIEDSYGRLDTLEDTRRELLSLTRSLIRRMHADLTEEEEEDEDEISNDDGGDVKAMPLPKKRRWLAHPRTLRLSTRLRPPPTGNSDPSYNINRISRSCPMPQFVFSLKECIEAISQRLVQECLIPAFRKLHTDKSGWKIGLMNIAATGMVESAGDSKSSAGRDIGKMFRTQDRVLREWRVVDDGDGKAAAHELKEMEPMRCEVDDEEDDAWEDGDGHEDENTMHEECQICGALMPHFAMTAHETYHALPD